MIGTPQSRIQMLKCSLRCFVFGGIGLVPVLGLPFSIVALVLYSRAHRQWRRESNPASRYLKWGFVLGTFGLLVSWVVSLVAGLAIVNRLANPQY